MPACWVLVRTRFSIADCLPFVTSSHCRKKAEELSGVSLSHNGTNPIHQAPSSWLSYLPKTLPPNTILLRVKISMYGFWGNTDIHSVHNRYWDLLGTSFISYLTDGLEINTPILCSLMQQLLIIYVQDTECKRQTWTVASLSLWCSRLVGKTEIESKQCDVGNDWLYSTLWYHQRAMYLNLGVTVGWAGVRQEREEVHSRQKKQNRQKHIKMNSMIFSLWSWSTWCV